MRTTLRPAAWVVAYSLVAGLLAGPSWPCPGSGRAGARLDTLSRGHTTPFLASPAPGDPTIVLTPRPAPWTIAEVRARFPAALATGGPSTLLLGQSLFVARGARLQVRGQDVRRLRLLSTPMRFVSLSGWRSAIEFTGSRLHPLTVSSWDPGRGGPDPARGRPGLRPGPGQLDDGDDRHLLPPRVRGRPHLRGRLGRAGRGRRQGDRRDPGQRRRHQRDLPAQPRRRLQRPGPGHELDPQPVPGQRRPRARRPLRLPGPDPGRQHRQRQRRPRLPARPRLPPQPPPRQPRHRQRAGGIVLGNGSATRVGAAGNTVISNTVAGNAAAGLVVDGGTGNRLRGNTVRGGRTGIELRNARANPVEGNTVTDVKGPGVDLDGGRRQQGHRQPDRAQPRRPVPQAGHGRRGGQPQPDPGQRPVRHLPVRGVPRQPGQRQLHQAGVQRHPGQGRPPQPDRREQHPGGHRLRHQPPRRRPRHPGAGQPGLGPGRPLAHRAAGQPGRAGRGPRGANRTDGWEVARPELAPVEQLRHFLRFHPAALLWVLVLLVPAVALPLRLWHRRVRRWYKTATTGRTDV
jgi:parallel beta-helix repeat protein